METTPNKIWTKVCLHYRENTIVADALSRLEKDDDEKRSEPEEGLVLSHVICAVEERISGYEHHES
jgi:hypothetical protein